VPYLSSEAAATIALLLTLLLSLDGYEVRPALTSAITSVVSDPDSKPRPGLRELAGRERACDGGVDRGSPVFKLASVNGLGHTKGSKELGTLLIYTVL
jgi:hypothetical protein